MLSIQNYDRFAVSLFHESTNPQFQNMRPWSKPFRRYAFALGTVEVDRDVARQLERDGLHVCLDDSRAYAYLVRQGPGLPGPVFVQELHRWIWPLLVRWSRRRALRPDELIHHDDGNKLNNRSTNLRARTRAEHAKEHAADRQRFSRRKRVDLHGFHRPVPPGPVRRLPAPQATQQTKAPSLAKRTAEIRARLADKLPAVRDRVAEFGCWISRPRPKARWDDAATYRLGLRRIRRRLTNAEAAFVGLMVLHHMDVCLVAEELNCERDPLERLSREPLVHEALLHWLRTYGLPYALLPRR